MGAMRARVQRTTGPFIPSSPIKELPRRGEMDDAEHDAYHHGDDEPIRHKSKRGAYKGSKHKGVVDSPASHYEDFGEHFLDDGDDSESEDDSEVEGAATGDGSRRARPWLCPSALAVTS